MIRRIKFCLKAKFKRKSVRPNQNNVAIVHHSEIQRYYELGFPTGRDSATFRAKGTEVSSLYRDKGTTGQAKNLTKGWDGPGQPKFRTGWAGTAKIRDGTGRDSQNLGRDAGQNGTELKKMF